MYLCADKHEEVCYESRNCPACEMRKTISDLEDKIDDLKETIKDMKEGNNG